MQVVFISFLMEKAHQLHIWISAAMISFSLISFICFIVAEFKKVEVKDVKLDGRLCYLPRSGAFGYGVGGLTCLVTSQIIGNVLVCRTIFLQGQRTTAFGILLLGLSWISFGITVTLISTATSMSREQLYGRGWLGGDCYVVKNGIYVASGVLVILDMGSTMGLVAITWRQIVEKETHVNTVTSGVLNANQNGRCISAHSYRLEGG